MALIIKDRVKETSTSIGTGNFTLLGATTGFQSFSVIGNGNSTYYCIADQNGVNWEVGQGTWSTGNTLSRNTVLSNSAGNTNFINFTSGTKDVFSCLPSEKALLGNQSSVGSTGSGNVVLDTNPTFNGNISANVNLRTGSLSTLSALAGGASEIASPNDANVLVKYNGVAGGAAIIGGGFNNGGTLNFTLTNTNVAAYTTGSSFIDCNGYSFLNVLVDSSLSAVISNLNIKLPLSTSINTLTINIPSIGNGYNWNGTSLIFTLAYQAGDSGSSYYPIAADLGHAYPYFDSPSNSFSIYVTLFSVVPNTWTRMPCISLNEGGYNTLGVSSTSIGAQILSTGSTNPISLTSNVTSNLSQISLPSGIWLITSSVDLTMSSTLNATVIYVAQTCTSPSTSPSGIQSIQGRIVTQQNLPTGAVSNLPLNTTVVVNSQNIYTYYANIKATFTGGTLSAKINTLATRIA